jgi:hypothetical protein
MIRRLTCLGLLACHVSACSTWRVQSLTPQRLLAEKRPSVIWVTRSTGGGVLLETPAIRNDSLVGWDGKRYRNVSIALPDVRSIEIREHDSDKTIYFALGVIAGTGLALVAIFYALLATDKS